MSPTSRSRRPVGTLDSYGLVRLAALRTGPLPRSRGGNIVVGIVVQWSEKRKMSRQNTQLPSPAEKTAKQQRGRPFKSGQSGNPNGRPKGSRNRVTQALEVLIHGEAEALGTKAVEMALDGDGSMLRALLSTLVPARRDRTVEFELPEIETAGDARRASSA